MPHKKSTKKKSHSKKSTSLSKNLGSTEKILVQNFVSLQKVMTNLVVKFDSLSTQISKLLDLFEISAKALAEKDVDSTKENKKIFEGINELKNQNKIIARGLTLLHEPQGEENEELPKQPGFPAPTSQSINLNEYQQSISSQSQEFKKLPMV